MPSIVYGNTAPEITQALRQKNFSYDYPENIDLKPGSELHEKLKNEILIRARESANIMSARYDSWNEMDQYLTAYKYVDESERKVLSGDFRKPVSIVFPYTYAIQETLLSYMISAFFRDPIFRYEGYSPEDVMGSILMEQIVQLHCNKFKVMLNLHTMFRDSFAYGIGVVAPIWKVHSRGNFEGNALINIDPYRYLPDPNVAADKIQDGEFVGWSSDTNYMDLLSEETSGYDVFNVKYLSDLQFKGTSIYNTDNSARNLRTGSGKTENDFMKPITEIAMYIKLIPSEWNLGDSDTPEKWFFRLASDSVIITARPADFKHDKFPVTVAVPDFDGYSSAPLGRLEILSGLQGILDWLFNSHIANVRKAINDMIIYDPYAINTNDLKDPKPGGLIRMRRPLWGKGGISNYIQQLGVNDITRANVADSSWIVQWMQKIGGTDDAAMGSLRSGGPERLTKAEFQGTASGAVSRLERIAKVIGLQAMQDIGEFFAEHTQQMMTDDMYIKVAGDWGPTLLEEYSNSISRGRMKVSPRDLDVMYDVIVRDGSIPGGNSSGIWMKMFETLSKEPQLAQQFDIVKIFKHIAREAGAKNVNEFVRRGGGIQAQTMSPEQVQQQAQAGNIQPMNLRG